jgi:hypothetical protein
MKRGFVYLVVIIDWATAQSAGTSRVDQPEHGFSPEKSIQDNGSLCHIGLPEDRHNSPREALLIKPRHAERVRLFGGQTVRK